MQQQSPGKVLVLDAGDMLAPSTSVRSSQESQRKLKAQLLQEAVAKMGIDAMTVGANDFTFGKRFLLQGAEKSHLPYICANLVDSETKELLFPPSKVISVGGLRVGIVGVTRSSLREEGVVSTEPIPAVRAAVRDLMRKPLDLIVALSNQKSDANEALARAVPELDVIVVGSTRRKQTAPNQVSNVLLLEAGSRGKFLGVLDATLVPGGKGWKNIGGVGEDNSKLDRYKSRMASIKDRLAKARNDREKSRYERQLAFYEQQIAKMKTPKATGKVLHRFVNRHMELGSKVGDDPEIARLVESYEEEMKQLPGSFKNGRHRSRKPTVEKKNIFGNFVGAHSCMRCHPNQYLQWGATPHAKAYASLERENRNLDLQCFGCHITGYGKKGGPEDPKQVSYLKNVQCEACHGAGREHMREPKKNHLRSKVEEAICVECHTPEQTEGKFVYSDYLSKISHANSPVVPAHSAGSETH